MAESAEKTSAPMGAAQWTKVEVGCYWSWGDYAIASVSGDGRPAGYVVYYRRLPISPRHATLADAQQIAERHAESTEAYEIADRIRKVRSV